MKPEISANSQTLASFLLKGAKKTKMVKLPENFTFQGHRGARGLLPENTIPSFLKCLSLGIHTMELDVVISQDNQVVVSHEPWFNPQICSFPDGKPVTFNTAHQHIIYQMPYHAVVQFDCGKRGNPDFKRQIPQPAVKPLLSEVIKIADEYAVENNLQMPVYNIEIKTENGSAGDGFYQPSPPLFVQLVNEIITRFDINNRVIVQSFDNRIVKELNNLKPDYPLSFLTASPRNFESQIKDLGFQPQIYAPHYSLVSKTLVNKVHQKGLKLITWTVNTQALMIDLIEKGVDSIITDYPDLAAELLQQFR